MRHRAIVAASLSALGLFVICSVSVHACPVGRGEHIVLASQELDPDVFLWDSSARVVQYATGDYDVDTVLKHTTLVKAFSQALALGCRRADIGSTSSGTKPAVALYVIGVRVVSGVSRGRWGWVLSSDVRGADGRSLTPQRQR